MPLTGWTTRPDGTLETDIELEPDETTNLELTLKWTNSEKNLGSKVNTAKIVSTENEAKYADTNTKDNTSEATIVVSIKTGVVVSIIIIIMILGSLGICGYVTISVMKNKQNIKDIGFLRK